MTIGSRTLLMTPRSIAMPTSAAMMLLEADLTLAGAPGRTPRGVVLGDELAAPAHEQAAQLRELGGGGAEIDERGRSSCRLRGDVRRRGQQTQAISNRPCADPRE